MDDKTYRTELEEAIDATLQEFEREGEDYNDESRQTQSELSTPV